MSDGRRRETDERWHEGRPGRPGQFGPLGRLGRFGRFAFARPHLLVLEGLGGTRARLAVEQAARAWGWPYAAGPADADLIVACGALPEGPLARVVAQTPLPRRLLRLDPGDPDVRRVLRAGRDALFEAPGDSAGEPGDGFEDPSEGGEDPGWRLLAGTRNGAGGEHGHRGHEGRSEAQGEPGGGEPEDEGHADEGHEGHGEHEGHGGHGEMQPPGGLAMAGTAPDRDGLTLDVLHVSLGPVLPWWPGGLRLDLAIQGDVVQEAAVRVPRGPHRAAAFWDEPWRRWSRGEPVTRAEADARRAAARLDGAARLLRVAGHDRGAYSAARLRDAVLATGPGTGSRATAALLRTVRRDVLLRWMLRDVAVTDGVDAWDRLLGWLDEAVTALERASARAAAPLNGLLNGPWDGESAGPHAGDLAACRRLPALVRGQDLATARLAVASLDPDINSVVESSGGAPGP